MLSIWSSLAQLPDPRSGNARRHDLLDVLTITLTASPMPAGRGGAEVCHSRKAASCAGFNASRPSDRPVVPWPLR
jgi:hypothetical protein